MFMLLLQELQKENLKEIKEMKKYKFIILSNVICLISIVTLFIANYNVLPSILAIILYCLFFICLNLSWWEFKLHYVTKERESIKENNKEIKTLSIAERLHDSYIVQEQVEQVIFEAFEKYEPEIYKKLELHIGSDSYDNSIEIYFDISLPYPYEPCKEIREAVYKLGFSSVYWNFCKDTMDVMCDRIIGEEPKMMNNSKDEIRDWEPRHDKFAHWIPNKYGYVDERFNEKEWEAKYNFKNK